MYLIHILAQIIKYLTASESQRKWEPSSTSEKPQVRSRHTLPHTELLIYAIIGKAKAVAAAICVFVILI